MNKNDLISAVAQGSGLSKADSARAVDEVLDSITNVTTNLLNVNDIYKDEVYEVALILPSSVKSNIKC